MQFLYMEPPEPSFRYMPSDTKLPHPTTITPGGSIHPLVSCLPQNDTNLSGQVVGHADLLRDTIDDAQLKSESQDMKHGLTQGYEVPFPFGGSCVFADQPDPHSFSILEVSNQTVSLVQGQRGQKTPNNPPRKC